MSAAVLVTCIVVCCGALCMCVICCRKRKSTQGNYTIGKPPRTVRVCTYTFLSPCLGLHLFCSVKLCLIHACIDAQMHTHTHEQHTHTRTTHTHTNNTHTHEQHTHAYIHNHNQKLFSTHMYHEHTYVVTAHSYGPMVSDMICTYVQWFA